MRRIQIASLLGILFAPALACAAPQTYGELVTLLIRILNTASGVAVTIAIAFFFWGIATEMLGDKERRAAKPANLLWGVFALFVMVSIWGLVALLTNTFFSGTTSTTGSTFCTGGSCE